MITAMMAMMHRTIIRRPIKMTIAMIVIMTTMTLMRMMTAEENNHTPPVRLPDLPYAALAGLPLPES